MFGRTASVLCIPTSNDHKPGDANGDAFGEFNGYRNGFKAFWLRDDFLDNAFRR